MQTFLPHPNFVASVMCLDRARLGSQRKEARQIQSAIQSGGAWANHPATLMWRDHIQALMLYGDCCIREWVRRGYQNNMPLMLARDESYNTMYLCTRDIKMPPWLGDEEFHSRHRAALLAKYPAWYGQWGWSEEPVIDYMWPAGRVNRGDTK